MPVGLLLVGIIVDGGRILAFDEDPQRGSAFAMFASVDISRSRAVLATAGDEREITLTIPDDLNDAREGVIAVPSEERIRRLADQLVQVAWEVEDGTASPGGTVTFDAVRVEVVAVEADGRRLTRRVLAEAEAGAVP